MCVFSDHDPYRTSTFHHTTLFIHLFYLQYTCSSSKILLNIWIVIRMCVSSDHNPYLSSKFMSCYLNAFTQLIYSTSSEILLGMDRDQNKCESIFWSWPLPFIQIYIIQIMLLYSFIFFVSCVCKILYFKINWMEMKKGVDLQIYGQILLTDRRIEHKINRKLPYNYHPPAVV